MLLVGKHKIGFENYRWKARRKKISKIDPPRKNSPQVLEFNETKVDSPVAWFYRVPFPSADSKIA